MTDTRPTPVPGRSVRLGAVVMTPGIQAKLPGHQLIRLLHRHRTGDWGDLCDFDWNANEEVFNDPEHNGRLVSFYDNIALGDGSRSAVWIITDSPESDQALTTVLLPDEY